MSIPRASNRWPIATNPSPLFEFTNIPMQISMFISSHEYKCTAGRPTCWISSCYILSSFRRRLFPLLRIYLYSFWIEQSSSARFKKITKLILRSRRRVVLQLSTSCFAYYVSASISSVYWFKSEKLRRKWGSDLVRVSLELIRRERIWGNRVHSFGGLWLGIQAGVWLGDSQCVHVFSPERLSVSEKFIKSDRHVRNAPPRHNTQNNCLQAAAGLAYT